MNITRRALMFLLIIAACGCFKNSAQGWRAVLLSQQSTDRKRAMAIRMLGRDQASVLDETRGLIVAQMGKHGGAVDRACVDFLVQHPDDESAKAVRKYLSGSVDLDPECVQNAIALIQYVGVSLEDISLLYDAYSRGNAIVRDLTGRSMVNYALVLREKAVFHWPHPEWEKELSRIRPLLENSLDSRLRVAGLVLETRTLDRAEWVFVLDHSASVPLSLLEGHSYEEVATLFVQRFRDPRRPIDQRACSLDNLRGGAALGLSDAQIQQLLQECRDLSASRQVDSELRRAASRFLSAYDGMEGYLGSRLAADSSISIPFSIKARPAVIIPPRKGE